MKLTFATELNQTLVCYLQFSAVAEMTGGIMYRVGEDVNSIH